jgi:hypothetical protein
MAIFTTILSRLQEEAGYKSVFLVRFEDLVTDPVRIIQRTCVYAGVQAAACWCWVICYVLQTIHAPTIFVKLIIN